jgi:hypothetical protein
LTTSATGEKRAEAHGIDLVEKLVEEFDVDEHGRGVGQFVRNDIEEGFWTEHITLRTCSAAFGLEGHDSKFENA